MKRPLVRITPLLVDENFKQAENLNIAVIQSFILHTLYRFDIFFMNEANTHIVFPYMVKCN